ncbi:MAG: hypothetical protein GXX10_10270 [Clostridiaceae bacterium]|nr:hypothetical protein [Clostridiaceae bacterium]
MNIGLIVPARENKRHKPIAEIFQTMGAAALMSLPVETSRIRIMQDFSLVLCTVSHDASKIHSDAVRKRLRVKLAKILERERAWPVLEHPKVKGIFNSEEYYFEEVVREAAVNRLPELLRLIRGIGDLSMREITVTGHAAHLELAITMLITKVKSLNLLLPEGTPAPVEAEMAFAETGIPVHITTDYEVLNRTPLWIRFPDDHECFDLLPAKYNGVIIDLGSMQIIDTRSKKIFNIVFEFSDKIGRKIGHSILEGWRSGFLEAAIIAICSNSWNISVSEASTRLGMRLSYKA